jgi:hypothetical protein
MIMSYYIPHPVLPTPNNPLIKLTDQIEEVVAQEPALLALSALASAALRLETFKCNGNRREAAERLAYAFMQIAYHKDARIGV